MPILSRRIAIRNRPYFLPDPLETFEELIKTHNLDIRGFEDIELYREELRLKLALASLDPHKSSLIFVGPGEFMEADTWLVHRIAAIRKERKHRREAWGYAG